MSNSSQAGDINLPVFVNNRVVSPETEANHLLGLGCDQCLHRPERPGYVERLAELRGSRCDTLVENAEYQSKYIS